MILSKLIFFPYPELFIYPYLTKLGLVPYKEIFDQHFPGIMFFPVNLASLGIDTPAEMRFVQYFLVIITQILIFFVSKKLFRSGKKAIFVNLVYLIWQPFFEGYVLWIDSFSTPLILASFYFLLDKFDKKNGLSLFLSGFLIGIALLFKQVTIPIILFSIIYVWRYFKTNRSLEKYTLGLAIPGLYLIYFVFKNNILNEFIYWTFTFNVTTFSEMGRKYPTFIELLKTSFFFGIPLLSIIYFYLHKKLKEKLLLVCLYLLGSLFFAYARFDYVHLQPALPYASILCIYIFTEIPKKKGIALTFIFLLFSSFFTIRQYTRLVGNEVLFYGSEERVIVDKVSQYSKKGDSIFAFATFPGIYQLTNTIPSGHVFVFQFPWFMVKAEDSILNGIKLDPPKVVIRDKNSEVSDLNLIKYMEKIDEHINKYYKTIDTVGNIEIMLPN